MTDKEDDNIRAIRPDIRIEREETPPEENLPEPNEELVLSLQTMLSMVEEGALQEIHAVLGYWNDDVEPISLGYAVDEYKAIGCLQKLLSTLSQPTIVLMQQEEE